MCDNNLTVDPFIAVKAEDMRKLISVLEHRLPRSANVYNTAVMLERVTLNVKIYTLNGDLTSNCWVLSILERQDYGSDINISVPVNPVITDDIRSAFITTKVLDWNSRYMFAAIDGAIAPMIADISAMVNGNATNFNPNYFYYMDRNEAKELNIELPDGLELKTLNNDVGIDFLVKNWKYTLDGTTEYTRQTVESCASSGVFKGDQPISGIILNPNGFLGMLYTANEFRGQGIAQLCMKSLAKSVANEGLVPVSCCEQKNLSSIAFHTKLGMKISHKVCFVMYTGSKW